MSVVKINAIAVEPGRGEELEKRFASGGGGVEDMPGFEGFELLRPVDGETRYFVYTRWESEEAFQGWVNSDAFKVSHKHARKEAGEKPVAHGSNLLAFEVVMRREATGV